MIAAGSAAIVGAGFFAAPDHVAVPELSTTDAPPEAPAPTPAAAPSADIGASVSGTFDGPAITNLRGTYQAQIVVEDGMVTQVIALAAGTDAPESVAINAVAIPLLTEQVLATQSAQVDAVSGASFTSPAFAESLEGAFALAEQAQ